MNPKGKEKKKKSIKKCISCKTHRHYLKRKLPHVKCHKLMTHPANSFAINHISHVAHVHFSIYIPPLKKVFHSLVERVQKKKTHESSKLRSQPVRL